MGEKAPLTNIGLKMGIVSLVTAIVVGLVVQQGPTTALPELHVPVDEAHTIRIVSGDNVIVLARNESTWIMTEPLQAGADGVSVGELLERTNDLKIEMAMSDNPDLYASYCVDDQQGRQVEIEWDGGSASFIVAGRTSNVHGEYIRVGDDPRVFLMGKRFFVAPDVDAWRDKLIVNVETEAIRRIEVESPDGAFELIAGDEWIFGDGTETDSRRVLRFIKQLRPLLGDGFLDPGLSGEVVTRVPAYTVSIEMEGDVRSLQFWKHDDGYAVVASGNPTVYLINRTRLRKLVPAQDSLRPH